jgi:glycosyltransferase involved in cell wall biosynthesis
MIAKKERIRVLFLSKDASRGGTQRILEYILKHLDATRFESCIALASGGPLLGSYATYAKTFAYKESAPGRCSQLLQKLTQAWAGKRGHGLLNSLSDIQRKRTQRIEQELWLTEIVQNFRPHLVVRNYFFPNSAFDAINRFRLPTLQHVFFKGSLGTLLDDCYLRDVLSRASHFLCEGRGTHTYLTSCLGIEPSRISTVCIGVDPGRCAREMQSSPKIHRNLLGISADAIVIASAGSINFWKGLDVWVRMAAILKSMFPDRTFVFLWIGGKDWSFKTVYGDSIQRLITRLGLTTDVKLIGDQSHVFPYLALCDIYVQPSRDDAFPHATMEAMMLGRPVVSSPEGIALEDYAQHAIVRVESDSADSLAAGVAKLINDPVMQERLGNAGQSLMRSRFDTVNSVRSYEEVLFRVIS